MLNFNSNWANNSLGKLFPGMFGNAASNLQNMNDNPNRAALKPVFDSYSSSLTNADIQRVKVNGQEAFVAQPSDEVVYNPGDNKVYLVRKNGNTVSYQEVTKDTNLFFPSSDALPASRDNTKLRQYIKEGDQLFYEEGTGRYYLKRQGAGGLEEIDINRLLRGELYPESERTLSQTGTSVDTQKEVSRISSSGQTFAALGVPDGLTTSYVDVSGVVPGFGDQTGATIASGIYVQAGLYTQMQKTINIINYLNTAPNGTMPNPNFSYIAGRPPYAQDTPEGRREQEKVFAALRTNIIAQLTRIAEQIKDTIAGLRTQIQAAESFKGTQDSEVAKWVKNANGGGGGGG